MKGEVFERVILLLSTFILSNSLDAGENTTKIIGDITYNTADFSTFRTE